MSDDDWLEEVTGFCWSGSGSAMLVQYAEMLRCFNVGPGLVETCEIPLADRDLIGFGHAAGDWWLCYRVGGSVFLRRGLAGEAIEIPGLSDAKVTRPSVSPDGRTLAGVVADQVATFWCLASGERRFGVRISQEDEMAIFGPPEVAEIRWSADSRYAVIRPEAPLVSMFLVDVQAQRVQATIG